MFELLVKEHFNAAHSLRGYQGKCANIHGHTWEVEVTVSGHELNELGMLLDFNDLKQIIKEEILIFDHQYINEIEAFSEKSGQNPTAENIARYIFHALNKNFQINNLQINLKMVKVWESTRACAIYKED